MGTRFWRRGERRAFAIAAGLQASHLSEILHRRRRVSFGKALELQQAAREFFKEDAIPAECWFFNHSTTHPAFYGPAVSREGSV